MVSSEFRCLKNYGVENVFLFAKLEGVWGVFFLKSDHV